MHELKHIRENSPLHCHLLQYVCGDNINNKYKISKKHVAQAGDFRNSTILLVHSVFIYYIINNYARMTFLLNAMNFSII